jgi:hypothetical protein
MNHLALPIQRAVRSVVLVVRGSQGGSSGCTAIPMLSFGTTPGWLSRSCSYSSTASNSNNGDNNKDAGNNGVSTTTTTLTSDVYLHVGPSGDCWTGHSIFAAKHLQPDYVKSVQLPHDTDIDTLLERLEAENALAKSIYDSGIIPVELLLQSSKQAKNNDNYDLTSPNPRLKR